MERLGEVLDASGDLLHRELYRPGNLLSAHTHTPSEFCLLAKTDVWRKGTLGKCAHLFLGVPFEVKEALDEVSVHEPAAGHRLALITKRPPATKETKKKLDKS